MADHVMVLHDQHVQQIDAPLDIYNHPANHFVAEFFGTPQINLLTAQTKGDRLIVDEHIEVALNQPLDAETYTVGIRPNQLDLVPAEAGQGNANVLNVETLGEQTIIEATLDNGTEVRIVKMGQIQVAIQQRVTVSALGPAFIFNDQQELIAEQGEAHDARIVTVS